MTGSRRSQMGTRSAAVHVRSGLQRLLPCLRALRPHQVPTRCDRAGRLLGLLIRV